MNVIWQSVLTIAMTVTLSNKATFYHKCTENNKCEKRHKNLLYLGASFCLFRNVHNYSSPLLQLKKNKSLPSFFCLYTLSRVQSDPCRILRSVNCMVWSIMTAFYGFLWLPTYKIINYMLHWLQYLTTNCFVYCIVRTLYARPLG